MRDILLRAHARRYNELRPVRVQYNVYGYADASVILEIGDTKVQCAVTLTQGVPPLRGKRTGWLTAEYAMLPTSTADRIARDSSAIKKNGRSVEISRLIGRSLRTVLNLDLLGENSITVDCDVLQADGGTRTACITGASLALRAAQQVWLEQGKISQPVMMHEIAAVSVGFVQGQALLDLDFAEDSSIDADFNVVMTQSGQLIELQGTAEKKPVSWAEFEAIRVVAVAGAEQLFKAVNSTEPNKASTNTEKEVVPLFSLQNRLNAQK